MVLLRYNFFFVVTSFFLHSMELPKESAPVKKHIHSLALLCCKQLAHQWKYCTKLDDDEKQVLETLENLRLPTRTYLARALISKIKPTLTYVCSVPEAGKFSRDGSKILVNHGVYNANNGQHLTTLSSPHKGYMRYKWSPQGNFIRAEKVLKTDKSEYVFDIWNAHTGNLHARYENVTAARMKFTADEKYLLFKEVGQELKVYDTQRSILLAFLGSKTASEYIMPQDPQARFICHYEPPYIHFYDMTTLTLKKQLYGMPHSFSSDGDSIIMRGRHQRIFLIDGNSLEKESEFISSYNANIFLNEIKSHIFYEKNASFVIRNICRATDVYLFRKYSDYSEYPSADLAKIITILKQKCENTTLVALKNLKEDVRKIWSLKGHFSYPYYSYDTEHVLLKAPTFSVIINIETGAIVAEVNDVQYLGCFKYRPCKSFSRDGKFLSISSCDKKGHIWQLPRIMNEKMPLAEILAYLVLKNNKSEPGLKTYLSTPILR